MTYAAHITVSIPSEIAAERHPEITELLESINARLAANCYSSRSHAIGVACNALSRSGASACGIAGAMNTAGRVFHR